MYAVANSQIAGHQVQVGEYLVWEDLSNSPPQLADGHGGDRAAGLFVFRVLALLMVMHFAVGGR